MVLRRKWRRLIFLAILTVTSVSILRWTFFTKASSQKFRPVGWDTEYGFVHSSNIYENGKESRKMVNIDLLNLMSDKDIQKELKGNNVSLKLAPNAMTCVHPDLQPWNELMKPFFKDVPDPECKVFTKNWIEVVNGTFVITPHAAQRFGNIACKYAPFIRKSDHETFEATMQSISNNSLIDSDFFRAQCTSSSGNEYSSIHAGIHYDEKLHQRGNIKPLVGGLGLDVLILGFDSMSRMTFIRKLVKTYKYLTEELQGVILKGYNIVGDGTPQALIPILTGKTELELPRTLTRLSNSKPVDVFPFIWKDFAKNGYVTAWSEDLPAIGTFTYRMNGFVEQPTDHYMRTFHLKGFEESAKHQTLCYGDRSRIKVVLDWIQDFMGMYRNKSKFGFVFHSELSHDDVNNIQTGDEELYQTLKQLNENGYMNRTMVILMSDHGARFSQLRATIQGKQEERNPFVSFVFPPWFKNRFPRAFENFRKNADRLVTPFDIYPTLFDILDFKGTGMGDTNQRSISLFKEIPLNRTCALAGIEPHWCNCLQWTQLPRDGVTVVTAAQALVNHINKITANKRDLCVNLTLKGIARAARYNPTMGLLKFKQSADADGYEADLSDSTHVFTYLYQINIYTSPNNGFYEATLTHHVETNKFTIKTEDVSRINKYGNDPHCIYDTDEHLRKFCFCKDKLASNTKFL